MSNPKTLLLVGAVLVGVGSLMPRVKIDTAFGSMTVNGTQGDGIITLILGGVLMLLALTRKGEPGKRYSLGALALAAIALIVSVSGALRIGEVAAENTSEYMTASVGTGLFVIILGSIIAGIGASKVLPVDASKTTQTEADAAKQDPLAEG